MTSPTAAAAIATSPPSLMFCIHVLEAIIRIPAANHTSIQYRGGALPLLESMSQRAKTVGDLQVTLLYPHAEFTGLKLLAPIMTRYPEFNLLCGAEGSAGRLLIERHWRERAIQLEAQNSLRILVAGTKRNLVALWQPDEVLLIPPYVAMTKEERTKKREMRRLASPVAREVDNTMKNIDQLLKDALSAPEAPVTDVLMTSGLVNKVHYPLLGNTFMLSST